MATATERSRLRSDTGHNETSLTNDEADAIYVRAAEEYSASAVNAGARVIAIDYLLGSATKLNDYVQNTSQEKASQVFDHLMKLKGIWEDRADRDSKADFGGGVLSGRVKSNIPRRLRKFPGNP